MGTKLETAKPAAWKGKKLAESFVRSMETAGPLASTTNGAFNTACTQLYLR